MRQNDKLLQQLVRAATVGSLRQHSPQRHRDTEQFDSCFSRCLCVSVVQVRRDGTEAVPLPDSLAGRIDA